MLLAAAALSGQFAIPYFTAPTTPVPGGEPYNLPPALADGVLNPLDNVGLLGLTGLGILCSLIAVFLFKNRMLQGRIAAVSVVVSTMLAVLAVIVLYQTEQQMTKQVGSFGLGLSLPVLALVFQYLAQRAIRKDENLVRSMDRLR